MPTLLNLSIDYIKEENLMIVISGKFAAKPDKRDELIQLAIGMFEPSRSESGCITYNFYEDAANPNHFLFFEEWKTQEDIDKHFQTEHFKKFMEKFPDLIIGEAKIRIYKVDSFQEL
jgi:quinol monooxygenase YgiN